MINKVIFPQILKEFHQISKMKGENSIMKEVVSYNSPKLDLGNNLAWPNSIKEEVVKYNSPSRAGKRAHYCKREGVLILPVKTYR
jgi:hypothetical protein